MRTEMNYKLQVYKGIPIQLLNRKYGNRRAHKFSVNCSDQTIWILKKHLLEDGTIKVGEDIDYVFKMARNICKQAKVRVEWL